MTEGEDIASSGVLRVYSGDYAMDSIRLVNDGQVWTPLNYGADYLEYVLQADGSFTIYAGSKIVFTFTNSSGLTPPAVLTGQIRARLSSSEDASELGDFSTQEISRTYYINYARKLSGDYILFSALVYFKADFDTSKLSADNADIVSTHMDGNFYIIKLRPVDAEKYITMSYDGYIVFFANY